MREMRKGDKQGNTKTTSARGILTHGVIGSKIYFTALVLVFRNYTNVFS